MNKFWKITGYTALSFILCLYLVFLLVLPHVVDLNNYKPQLQQLVKDNAGVTVDFDSVNLITSPLLEAGIKAKNLKVKLPDDSVFFSADSVRTKLFLPSLLKMSVRVSAFDVESPNLNVEIMDGQKFKAAKVYEDIINKQREERRLNPPKFMAEDVDSLPFDVSKIKIFIPSVKLNNYKVVIDDTKSSHKLTLKGEMLKFGYFNGKVAKLKTDAKFLSDEDTNITANIDINTFLPEFPKAQVEEDNEAVFALPFVNPVEVYRDYNLKSDISTKLKIRQNKKNKKIWAKGFFNIDNTTVTLSGLELPKSYFKVAAHGYRSEVDSNLFVTDSEYLNFTGKFNYGKKHSAEVALKSTKVHFSNILTILKAYLDTIHVKNDIAQMSASGYLFSNFRFKTDFQDLKSDGKFIIRDGNIFDKSIGLLFNNINANFLFDDNIFEVKNTHVLINKQPLDISGKIDSDSIANINITANKIPLPGLYLAFAPKEVKNAYDLKSGFLSLNVKVRGEIKEILALCKADLEDFIFNDRAGTFVISNKLARFGVLNYSGEVRGKFKNRGFRVDIPATRSVIADEILVADIDSKNIVIRDSDIRLNKNSLLTLNGQLLNYISTPQFKANLKGSLADSDLKILAGDAVAPFLDSKGAVPVKAEMEAKGDKVKAVVQMLSSANSYITPVRIDEIIGKQLLVQLLVEKNDDVVKVYKSGLYLRKPSAPFRDNLALNLLNAREIVRVRAMISNLSTNPFINLFKVTVKDDLNGSICVFPQSKFIFGGKLHLFGYLDALKIDGNFYVRNLRIPELMTTVRDINAHLGTRDVRVNIRDVISNGSDFNINILSNWNLLSNSRLADVRVNSRLIDVDKLMQVSEAAMKALPSANTASSSPADIPVEILRGSINLRRIVTGNIVADNTTGRISLFKNIFYLNDLRTLTMKGNVIGDVSMNLVTTELNAKLSGRNFDVEKILLDVMDMKDTLSGDLNFIADISLKGVTMEEQMKTLKGFADFNIKDGQLGPFGKFENFLMAENIRENAFFSSTIGSVITNIVTIDTSHFNSLFGHLTFKDGFAEVFPIKSQGDVMSMYIAGKVGLIDNSADLKLRGKLASAFSDHLGPLANINPVNLIKNTPGLNVVAAKSFSIFCEAVSEEEMKAIPELDERKSDDYATKFQIILHGDTRKPLKMIKSFKWLALNSEIESAQNFVDTIPVPQAGEENLSVEELIKLRAEQAAAASQPPVEDVKEDKSIIEKFKDKFKKESK